MQNQLPRNLGCVLLCMCSPSMRAECIVAKHSYLLVPCSSLHRVVLSAPSVRVLSLEAPIMKADCIVAKHVYLVLSLAASSLRVLTLAAPSMRVLSLAAPYVRVLSLATPSMSAVHCSSVHYSTVTCSSYNESQVHYGKAFQSFTVPCRSLHESTFPCSSLYESTVPWSSHMPSPYFSQISLILFSMCSYISFYFCCPVDLKKKKKKDFTIYTSKMFYECVSCPVTRSFIAWCMHGYTLNDCMYVCACVHVYVWGEQSGSEVQPQYQTWGELVRPTILTFTQVRKLCVLSQP